MATSTPTSYRPGVQPGHDRFGQLVLAEWTKLRTVRGWVPGGEPVSDSCYLVHQRLTGNGSLTVRVTALTGLIPVAPSGAGGRRAPRPVSGAGQAGLRPGLVPWAKAVVILTASTRPGAAYAAMLVTAAHGVRMQDDYTQDIAVTFAAGLAAAVVVTLLRRSAGSVATVIVVIVLPYLLTVTAPVLPAGLADWVLRITPAAAISVQQVMPQYAQVSNVYTPAQGFFPLSPWAGLAVLGAWAALALGLAVLRLRRADA